MNKQQELLMKKFKIKKTKIQNGKRKQKSDGLLQQQIYNKMKVKDSVGTRPSKKICNAYLSQQIKRNISSKKWSYKQAIAIAYNQIKRKQSGCKKYYT